MFTPFLTGLVLGNCMAGLWLVAGAQFMLPIKGASCLQSPIINRPRLNNRSLEFGGPGLLATARQVQTPRGPDRDIWRIWL